MKLFLWKQHLNVKKQYKYYQFALRLCAVITRFDRFCDLNNPHTYAVSEWKHQMLQNLGIPNK